MDQQPHGQWRCCVAYDQGQHGGVDASEWTRKCELAGIFYSCEYVHRAVLATLRSASAPYLEALTIGLLVILLFFTAHSASPSVPMTSLPTHPQPIHSQLTTHPPLSNPSNPIPHPPLPPQHIQSQPTPTILFPTHSIPAQTHSSFPNTSNPSPHLSHPPQPIQY